MLLRTTILLVTILVVSAQDSLCPTYCTCKWKGGKQTIECINMGLNSIPLGIESKTQVLDLSKNNIKVLTSEKFLRLGLLNLQKIYLVNCKISDIDDRAFFGLTNLVELDLSNNLLTTVPTKTFIHYKSLMRLNLNGNPIKMLRSQAFKDLQYLSSLELSNCEIEKVEEQAFKGLYNLEWLKLNGNKIKTMRATPTLPKAVKGVDLFDNPWYCNCDLINLRNWLINFKMPSFIEPRCSTPIWLLNETIKDLDRGKFACAPLVSPATTYLEAKEERNVSLQCKVKAAPEAQITWYYRQRPIKNESWNSPNRHSYHITEEGLHNKSSILFISQANRDDNGTFICVARNKAGSASGNFTLQIIAKPPLPIMKEEVPMKYVLIVGGLLLACIVIIILIICCLLAKCTCAGFKHNKRNSHTNPSNVNQTFSVFGSNGSTIKDTDMTYQAPVATINQNVKNIDYNPDIINNVDRTSSDANFIMKRSQSYQKANFSSDINSDIPRHDSYKEAMDNALSDSEVGFNTLYEKYNPRRLNLAGMRHSDEDIKLLTTCYGIDSSKKVSSIYDPQRFSFQGTPSRPTFHSSDNFDNFSNVYRPYRIDDDYPEDFGLPRRPRGIRSHNASPLTRASYDNTSFENESPYNNPTNISTLPRTNASTLPRNYGSYRSNSLNIPRTNKSGIPVVFPRTRPPPIDRDSPKKFSEPLSRTGSYTSSERHYSPSPLTREGSAASLPRFDQTRSPLPASPLTAPTTGEGSLNSSH